MAPPGLLRILLVEDEATDAELCARELHRGGIAFEMNRVESRETFQRALHEFRPDLIISDFSLPTAFDGLLALDLARKHAPDVPFVFVSGTIGEERAVEALKRGATDYVLKDRLSRLVPVVRRALKEHAERRARAQAESALAETRSRLDSILESITDAVWSIAPAPYRVIYLNPAVQALWGRPREFFDDRDNWMRAVLPEDAPGIAESWRAMLDGGEPGDAEYRIVRADGSVCWLHVRSTPIRDVEGSIVRIDGIARDVTTRKAQEERIARLSRIHAMMSAINSLIVRERNRQNLFDAACRIAVDIAGLRMAWIGLVDEAGDRLQPVAHHGHEAGFLRAVGVTERPVAGHPGAAPRAVREKRPVVLNDLQMDPVTIVRREALDRGYRALAALPLMQEHAAAGVMVLYSGEPGFFNAEEMKLLEELAGDIAFAMDHIAKTERLDYLAYYDGLTGLPNRNLYFDRLAQLLHAESSPRSRAAAVVIDVAGFRAVNDSFGTPAGDALLQQVGERLRRGVPHGGLLTRLGADRFAFAMPEIADASDAVRLLEEKLLPALAEPYTLVSGELHLHVKAGMALFPGDGADAQAVMKNAEAALQTAKRESARYRFYEPSMNFRVADRLNMEHRLRIALRRQEFELHYQPRVHLATGELLGLEALLRWPQPSGDAVTPDRFIPVLERTGMIIEVGAWVVREALEQSVRWRAEGLAPQRIAVNVSSMQLRQPDFVKDLLACARASRADPSWLALELTESMLMDSLDAALAKLHDVRSAGIDVYIDDFGTGYSSLSYLARLPVTALKIDQSFIARMTDSPQYAAVVATIVSLGRSLNLQVVAEGVETQAQSQLLQNLDCTEGQGFLFDRALPASEVRKRLRRAATS